MAIDQTQPRRRPEPQGQAGVVTAGAGPSAPAGPRHLGLALVVISMAQLMLVLDELIVNTALPRIHPGYAHALSSGVTSAMEIGACAGLLALVITLVAIRVRREDLPDGPVVM